MFVIKKITIFTLNFQIILSAVYSSCNEFLSNLAFNTTSSVCLVYQASPNQQSDISQYLSSAKCLNVFQYTCGLSTSNFLGGNSCLGKSQISTVYNSNQYFSRVGVFFKSVIYSGQIVTDSDPQVYINNIAYSYNSPQFTQYCANHYSNTFQQNVSLLSKFLNVTFSAQSQTAKNSYPTFYTRVIIALQYCPNNCNDCDDVSCYQCQQGYYPAGLNCLACNASCLSCRGFGPSQCIICSQANSYISMMQNNICVSQCDLSLGQYIDTTNPNQKYCRQCNNQCQTCQNSSSCTSCKVGYYLNNNTCLSCDSSCLTCNGSGPSQCIICAQANSYISVMQNNICVSQCDLSLGQYVDTSNPNQKYCRQCNSSCKTCQNSTYCTSCKDGYYLNNNTCLSCDSSCLTCNGSGPSLCIICSQANSYISIMQNSNCVSQCDLSIGQYIDTTNPNQKYCRQCNNQCQTCQNSSSCTSCKVGYYLNNNICLSCDSSCQTCNGSGPSQCIICAQANSYISVMQNNICVSQCDLSLGQYIDTTNPNQKYCRQCNNQCQTCQNSSSCTSCKVGYYLNNNTCLSCDSSCLTCNGSGPSQCIICAQANSYISVMQNNICVSQCDLSLGQFVDTTNPNQKYCRLCNNSCQTCQNSSSCTSCKVGYYLNNNTCLSCDSSCQTCNGSGPSQCIICAQANSYISVMQNNICVSQCDLSLGQYVDTSNPNQKYCRQCNSSCKTCQNGTDCTSCKDGYYLNNNTCLFCDSSCLTCNGSGPSQCIICAQANSYISVMQNNICVSQCDLSLGQFVDTTNPNQKYCRLCNNSCQTCQNSSSCTSCKVGYYLNNNTCLSCDSSCLTCNGSGPSQCIICAQANSYISVMQNNICVSQCDLSLGQYIDTTNPNQKYCRQCNNQCQTCQNSSSCTSCKVGYYLNNNTCLSCDSSCLTCNGSGPSQCIICAQANSYISVMQNNICVSQCDLSLGQYVDTSNPNQKYCRQCNSSCKTCQNGTYCTSCKDGYYLNNNTCLSCDSSCLTCNGSGPSLCIICSQANSYISIMQNNICVSQCDLSIGQYVDTTNPNQQYCRLCNNSCQTCQNSSSCTSCKVGYYLNNNTCLSCDSSCLTCNGSGPSQCIICAQANSYISVMQNNICVSQCDLSLGQYVDTSNPNQKYCRQCNSSCKTCQNGTDCTSCKDGYYLNNNTCLFCDSSCLTCNGSGPSQCIICAQANSYISVMQNNICVSQCDLSLGQFVDTTNPNQKYCRLCNNSCQTCQNSSSCTSCKVGYYLNNNTCLSCDSSCLTCNGSGPSQCIICAQANSYISVMQNNICVSQCDLSLGQYIDTTNPNQKYCRQCNNQCQTCQNSSSCTSCKVGYYLNNNTCLSCDSSCLTCNGSGPSQCIICAQANSYISVMQNNICVSQCDLSLGQYVDTSNPNQKYCRQCNSSCKTCQNGTYCTSCKDGYYLNNNTCLSCDSSCLTCNGSGPSLCIICSQANSYISIMQNNICVSQCDLSIGQYVDTTNPNQQYCRLCNNSCQTCQNSSSCTSCKVGYYLNNNTCLSCDSSCLTCNGSGPSQCIICAQANSYISVMQNNICVSQCDLSLGQYVDTSNPNQKYCRQCNSLCQTCQNGSDCSRCKDGYYLNNNTCLSCDSSCLTCKGSGPSQCIICSLTNSYISEMQNNKCISFCDLTQSQYVDYSDSQQMYCRVCNKPCLTCNGSTSCNSCQSGYYLNNNQCEQCDDSCLSCSGPTNQNCTICKSQGYFIATKQNYICVPQCDITQGQYIDLSNPIQSYCRQCISFCQTCQNNLSCQNCINGYYLNNNNCFKCDNSCLLCTNSGPSNCTVCSQSNYYISTKQNNQCVQECDLMQAQYEDYNNSLQKYCRQCPNECQTCTNYENCTSCIQGYFLNGSQCQQCDISCQSCKGFGSTNCTICKEQNYYISIKENNLCVQFCDVSQAQYIDLSNPSQQYCRKCNDLCKTCNDSVNCLTCKDGFYLNQNQCKQCDSSCFSCTGPSPSDCLICYQKNYFISIRQNNNCVPQCDISLSQFVDNSNSLQSYCKSCLSYCQTCNNSISCLTCNQGYYLNQNICSQCDPSCLSCSGPTSSDCIICKQQGYYISTRLNNICTSQCDVSQSQFIDTVSNIKQPICRECNNLCQTCNNSYSCLTCLPGHLLKNGQCSDCDPTCLFCNGPGPQNCIVCKQQGYFISTSSNNLCVSACDITQGQFIDKSNPLQSICRPCLSFCQNCFDSQYIDSTTNPQQLYCRPCSSFCKICNSEKSCQICLDGYYLNGSVCSECDPSCQSCSGPTSSNCIICKQQGYYISTRLNNICTSQCDVSQSQFIDTVSNIKQPICRECNSLCQTCNDLQKCTTCKSSFYLNDGECSTCDSSCLFCNGPGPQNCIVCKLQGYFISTSSNNLCVSACDITQGQFIDKSNPLQSICKPCLSFCQNCFDSQYIDSTTNPQQLYCRPCSSFCKTCNNEKSCQICSDGYYLNGSVCSQCDPSCLSCSGPTSSDCIICKQQGYYISTRLNNICTSQCDVSQSQFIDTVSNIKQPICRECNNLCQTCNNSYSCLTCLPGHLLKNGQCSDCDPTCLFCNGPGPQNCIVCKQQGYFISTSSNNLCVSACDITQGQFIDKSNPLQSICRPCLSFCQNCFDSQYIDSTTNPQQLYCRPCSSFCKICNSEKSCQICLDGYYLNGSVCSECDPSCLSCSGPTSSNCIICKQQGYYISTRLNNICTSQCDVSQSQFIDTVSNIKQPICRECNSLCQTCNDLQKCTTCKSSFYLNDGECSTCDSSCLFCNGPGPQNCIVCKQQGYFISTSSNNLCVSACDITQGQFIDKNNPLQSICKPCLSFCQNCFDSQYIDSTTNPQQLYCRPCSSFCKICNSEKSCQICSDGYYLNGSVCSQCDPSCLSCSGPTSSDCIICKQQGYYISTRLNNICTSQCDVSQSQFIDTVSNIKQPICRECNSLCQTCNNSYSCLTCLPGHLLKNGQCSDCDPTCLFCNGPGPQNCIVCKQQGYFISTSSNNLCVSACDITQGQFIDKSNPLQSICRPCLSFCQNCFDSQYIDSTTNPQQLYCRPCSNFCKTCNNEKSCQICKEGYYLNEQTCSKCDQSCQSCYGPSPSECIICKQTGFYISIKQNNSCVQNCDLSTSQFIDKSNPLQYYCRLCNQQCLTCKDEFSCATCYQGYFLKEKQCFACHDSCQICKGPNSTDCIRCKNGLFYQYSTSKCAMGCESNEFIQDQTCIQCEKSCKNCQNLQNCQSCNTGYYLFQNTCVQNCPNGYQKNTISQSCDLCEDYTNKSCLFCHPTCQNCLKEQIQNLDYIQNLNQTIQNNQLSQSLNNDELSNLNIIGEDLSRQQFEELNQIKMNLISFLLKKCNTIAEFSLLPTSINKIAIQLMLSIPPSIQIALKQEILNHVEYILMKTQSLVSENRISSYQQSNEFIIQNLADSFRLLDISISQFQNNTQSDYEKYIQYSNLIGNILSYYSLPNQEPLVLNGNLSIIVHDKITKKNLNKYIFTKNNQNENYLKTFSIIQNIFFNNIYQNTTDFQDYLSLLYQAGLDNNFIFSMNKLILLNIKDDQNQSPQYNQNYIYNFSHNNQKLNYNMTCIQYKSGIWSNQLCSIFNQGDNQYTCFCSEQLPTTIIEDFNSQQSLKVVNQSVLEINSQKTLKNQHKNSDKNISPLQDNKTDNTVNKKFTKRKRFVKLINYQVNINQLEQQEELSEKRINYIEFEKKQNQQIKEQVKLYKNLFNIEKKFHLIPFMKKLIIFHSTFGIYQLHNNLQIIFSQQYQNCSDFLNALAFNATSSSCIVYQGLPSSQSDFSSYLSSAQCLNIFQYTCGQLTQNFIGGSKCFGNNQIQLIYNSNKYFSRVGVFFKSIIYSGFAFKDSGNQVYINNSPYSYDNQTFSQYCANHYSNIFQENAQILANSLNVTFSAQSSKQYYPSFFSRIIIALQYCPNQCVDCDDKSCKSCLQGYYPAGLNCLKCDSSCQSCTGFGPSKCIICQNSTYFISIKQNNTCVQQCDKNASQYIDISNPNQKYCRQCSNQCLTCENASACTSCVNGYYLNNGNCLQCDSSCLTCTGQSPSQCIICSKSNSFISIKQNSICVSVCDPNQGQYVDKTNPQQMYCRLCSYPCLTCTSLFIDQSNPLQSYCRQCQDFCQSCQNQSSCLTCIVGYFLNGNQCFKCDISCLSCTSSGQSNCTICQQQNFYISISQNNQCVPTCDVTQAQYVDTSNSSQKFCRKCIDQCQICNDGVSCITCKVGFYLSNNQCKQCDNSCFSCNGPTSSDCLICKQANYFISTKQNNTCIPICDLSQSQFIDNSNPQQAYCKQCPSQCLTCNNSTSCIQCIQGYYKNLDFCYSCDDQCLSCLDSGSSCIKCKQPGYFISPAQNNKCVDQCDTTQAQFIDTITNAQQKYCRQCKSLCQTCNDSLSCLTCIQGYYLNGNQCQKCDTSCLTCSGPSQSDCIICQQQNYYISTKLNNICVSDCDLSQSQYIDNTNLQQKYCRQCDNSCQTCINLKQCTSCLEGYQLNGNLCSICKQGQYRNGQTCQLCDSSCLACTGPGPNNCTICQESGYFISTQQNNICVQNCDTTQSQYIDQTNSLQFYCRQCNQLCQTCKDGVNCLTCVQGYYLIENQCYACHNSCKTCNGPNQINCITCKDDLYYQQSTSLCTKTCKSNEYIQNQMCIQCDKSCASCLSLQNCLSCNQDYYLFQNTCVLNCPNGYKNNTLKLSCDFCGDDLNGSCQFCYPTCQECKQEQIQAKKCTSCYNETRYLDQNGFCSCDYETPFLEFNSLNIEYYIQCLNVNLTIQNYQLSQNQNNDNLLALSIIGEDLSTQSLDELDQIKINLISYLLNQSQTLADYSLLSTFINKVTIQLYQSIIPITQITLKQQIQSHIQNLIIKTKTLVSENRVSSYQQNNDFIIQNLVDSFKLLDISIQQSQNNNLNDYEYYIENSNMIGIILSKQYFPNQGPLLLNGSISYILLEQITYKHINKYTLINKNEQDQKQQNTFSVVQNIFKQNIYENTTSFQDYLNQLKNAGANNNYIFTKNKIITLNITSIQNQININDYKYLYDFSDSNSSMLYNMTCIQFKSDMWTDQQCNLLNKGMNQYTCFCKEQLPTTLIEDINSIKLINNSLQSPIEQQTIFDYVAFWMIQLLTITFFILFALGKYLDFKSISQTCKQNENLKVASLSGLQLKQNERTQKQTLKLKNINQQQNSEHKPQDKIISVVRSRVFYDCTQMLTVDKFSLSNSECIINQGPPSNISEYTQNSKYLQSAECMNIQQLACNSTIQNYISGSNCNSNSIFIINITQSKYIFQFRLFLQIIIDSNSQLNFDKGFLNINGQLFPYDNVSFQQFCSMQFTSYYNTFSTIIQDFNQNQLNISFSALPNFQKSYHTYIYGIFLAVEYCPDNCSKCSNSTTCLQCKVGYYLSNSQCIQCDLSCLTFLEENNDDENEEQEAGQNTQKNHNEFTSNIQLKQTQKQKEELKNDQLEAQNYEKILFFKKEYFKIYSFNFLLLKNYAYSFNFDNFCTV
ncbi:hypothetical protein ABPG73_014764 [Tetrahymena malaccensis]